MRVCVRPRPFAQAAILAVLSLVLLLRTLIPAGYMIAPSGGGLALTLCEAPAAPAHHQDHEAPAEPRQPCAYAALAAPALPPEPPLLAPAPAPSGSASTGWIVAASTEPGPASSPPPSTGPPHRV